MKEIKLRHHYTKHECKTCLHEDEGYCMVNLGSQCYNNNHKNWKRKPTNHSQLIDVIRKTEKNLEDLEK